MQKLLLSLAVIMISLFAGYLVQQMVNVGKIGIAAADMTRLRQRLQTFAMFGLLPISAMLALWGLPSPDPRLLCLPLLGISAWVTGGIFAILLARCLGLDRRHTGCIYCCGTFTNIGAVGALVSVIWFGEQAIAIVTLYRLCEEMFYFSISYPIAKWYSQPAAGRLGLGSFRLDPVLRIVLAALALGICLRLLSVPRPEFCGGLAAACTIASSVIFLFAIGLGLRLGRLGAYIRPSLAVCAIKFVLVPLVVVSLGWLAGLGQIEAGLPLQVVAILASMPVAMVALVPPSLFDLDLDMANACWLFSTFGLVCVLPWLAWLLPRLGTGI